MRIDGFLWLIYLIAVIALYIWLGPYAVVVAVLIAFFILNA